LRPRNMCLPGPTRTRSSVHNRNSVADLAHVHGDNCIPWESHREYHDAKAFFNLLM
jgi:hypothetical protein